MEGEDGLRTMACHTDNRRSHDRKRGLITFAARVKHWSISEFSLIRENFSVVNITGMTRWPSWLRRQTRNLIPFGSVGSNPALVENFFCLSISQLPKIFLLLKVNSSLFSSLNCPVPQCSAEFCTSSSPQFDRRA